MFKLKLPTNIITIIIRIHVPTRPYAFNFKFVTASIPHHFYHSK